jgi:hypothetical protein
MDDTLTRPLNQFKSKFLVLVVLLVVFVFSFFSLRIHLQRIDQIDDGVVWVGRYAVNVDPDHFTVIRHPNGVTTILEKEQ